uniref:Uncharacterized protein n=1 Tax=Solanum tuberosum TaxID=4113 RepID=M1DIC1_SOLTU
MSETKVFLVSRRTILATRFSSPFLIKEDNVPQGSTGDTLSSLCRLARCSAIHYIFADLLSLGGQSTRTIGNLKNIRRIAEALSDHFTPSPTGQFSEDSS